MKKSGFNTNAIKTTTTITATATATKNAIAITATAANSAAATATATVITDETTLNELISLARNNAVEKPETTPKFGTLRKKCRSGEYHCIASIKDAMFELYVYDCGYAGYESYGKATVIDLDDIFTVMYPSNYYDASL